MEGVDFGEGAAKLILETEGEGEIAVYADNKLLGAGSGEIEVSVSGSVKALRFTFKTTGIQLKGWKAE